MAGWMIAAAPDGTITVFGRKEDADTARIGGRMLWLMRENGWDRMAVTGSGDTVRSVFLDGTEADACQIEGLARLLGL